MAVQLAFREVDVAKVDLGKHNPRRDTGDLDELVASIKSSGVLEAIVVIEKNGRFEAVTGSRRLAASKVAGLKTIPARVMDLTEAEQAAAGLIENLQRKDLNAVEEAQAFHDYLALTDETQAALAKKIGRAPGTIANALRLLDTAKPVKDGIVAGWLGAAHGLEMLKLADPSLVAHVLKEAKKYDAHENGKPKVGTTIPLRIIADLVDRTNRDYREQQAIAALPDLLARRKAELEAKQITVTWAPKERYGGGEQYHVTTYLGEPKAKIVVAGYEMAEWKAHKTECGCDAVALTIEHNYRDVPAIKVQDVCIDAKKGRLFLSKRANRWNGGQARKGLTKADRIKIANETARKRIDHIALEPENTPKHLAALRKITRRDLGTEIARVVLFAQLYERWTGGVEQRALWDAVAALPLAKVKAKIVLHAINEVVPHVWKEGKRHYAVSGMTAKDQHVEPMLAKFHVTLAEADLLPKLDLDKAKKQKAKPIKSVQKKVNARLAKRRQRAKKGAKK